MASILLFDSGVGGLSVYKHLKQQLGRATIHYLADNARFPYGELDPALLIEGCVALIEQFIRQRDVGLVVIACNSASTLVLDSLRQRLSVPVVGVVPAIKPAAEYSKTKSIGLLATAGTIQRQYTEALINDYASDCRVIRVGSNELVKMAELKLAGTPCEPAQLARIVQPFVEIEPKIDCIVLGCTHFPLVAAELQHILGRQVKLIDSGAAVAKQVLAQLQKHQIGLNHMESAKFCFTGSEPNATLTEYLAELGLVNQYQIAQ